MPRGAYSFAEPRLGKNIPFLFLFYSFFFGSIKGTIVPFFIHFGSHNFANKTAQPA